MFSVVIINKLAKGVLGAWDKLSGSLLGFQSGIELRSQKPHKVLGGIV